MMERNPTKAVFFDVAGTLIQEKSWVFLMDGLGLRRQYDRLIFLLKKKKLGQGELNQRLKRLLKGGKIRRSEVIEAVRSFSWRMGAEELMGNLREKNIAVYLVSGANDILVKMVAEKLEVDGWEAATKFIFDQDEFLIDIFRTDNQAVWKVESVRRILQENRWDKSEVYFVGDGWNDIAVFEYLKRGLTFSQANPELKTSALAIVKDLPEIAKIV